MREQRKLSEDFNQIVCLCAGRDVVCYLIVEEERVEQFNPLLCIRREMIPAEALPGDIVYYGWHVGIYIGNGQMIHAPEEGDVVKISTVDWAAHTFIRCW